MKRFYFLKTALFFTVLLCVNVAHAVNSVTTVTQVTTTVNINSDVDYTITDKSNPFTSSGSVNIVNADHAVVILSAFKPSQTLNKWMKYIYINGVQASNDVNCQVKMYGRGTIILPYPSDFKPLTCYTEQNFEGESCDNYTEGSNGGYMKNLNTATLNNNIKSFKLKRGYMVTFAVGQGGWGYSRCFIADKADLEVKKLSNVLDGRISSYRIFKWHNAHKAGLASDGRIAANNAVNSSWCYDWAGGNESTMPDTEWVPNHIYEDWPSPSACGSRTNSCHMKTNNEPGNSADDHPQTVDEVLANWQNLMRTGMRLCSESSHDGSMSHLSNFIDSIDARGWRCDILDLHCYWASGTFNSLTWYSDNYGKGRPIWISEWVWGASWNNNGIFGSVSDRGSFSKENQQVCYNGTKPILDVLNSNKRVERYAYWNSEANCSKIYLDGKLSILGEYYSTMDVGLGYNPANEYVPKDPRIEKIGTLKASYIRKDKKSSLTWTDINGDLATSITIQCKFPDTDNWQEIGTVNPKDRTTANGASYSFSHDIEDAGIYYYRIMIKTYKGDTPYYSNEAYVSVDPSQGTSEFQYGKLTLNADVALTDQTTYFSERFSSSPLLFTGTRTTDNKAFLASDHLSSSAITSFKYRLKKWTTCKTTLVSEEEMPFMALKAGNYDFGIQCEAGTAKAGKASGSNLFTDTAEVVFNQPFAEGVVPVVLTQILNPNMEATALGTRIFDITNTGFKFIIYPEENAKTKITLAKTIYYFAIEPGLGTIDEENSIYIAAGHGEKQIYGTALLSNYFRIPSKTNEEDFDTLYLYKPIMFTELQTNNYPALCQLFRNDLIEQKDGSTWTNGTRLLRIMDHTITVNGEDIPYTSSLTKYKPYRDNMGWVAVTTRVKDVEPATAIHNITDDAHNAIQLQIDNRKICVKGADTFVVYTLSGMKVNSENDLDPGVYVVRANGKSLKVLIK